VRKEIDKIRRELEAARTAGDDSSEVQRLQGLLAYTLKLEAYRGAELVRGC
jgi:hypothetical protein